MSSAKDGLMKMEQGQQAFASEQMTDSGDKKTFAASVEKFSGAAGKDVTVKQNGILTGAAVTPNATDNVVDVAALTCNLNGSATSVSADTATITRAITDTHIINSITINSAGSVVVVSGSEGTSFSETRGAAGGPAYIPTDSIEIAQVRTSAQAAGAISADEIFQVAGLHKEMADARYTVDYDNAEITFDIALPAIHSDDSGTTVYSKAIYVSGYAPIMSNLIDVSSFSPPETSISSSSTAVFGGTRASTAESLDSGSFEILLEDGITDSIVANKNQLLHFEFYPSKYSNKHIAGQAYLGVSRSFSPDSDISASCTLNPVRAWNEVSA